MGLSGETTDWIKSPCDDCTAEHKLIDEYGYFCDMACGKRTAWINKKAGAEAMYSHLASMTDDELVEEIANIIKDEQKEKRSLDAEARDFGLLCNTKEITTKYARQISAILKVKIEEAVEKERERIELTIGEYIHFHRGEWCFSPKKYHEFMIALKGEPHD